MNTTGSLQKVQGMIPTALETARHWLKSNEEETIKGWSFHFADNLLAQLGKVDPHDPAAVYDAVEEELIFAADTPPGWLPTQPSEEEAQAIYLANIQACQAAYYEYGPLSGDHSLGESVHSAAVCLLDQEATDAAQSFLYDLPTLKRALGLAR